MSDERKLHLETMAIGARDSFPKSCAVVRQWVDDMQAALRHLTAEHGSQCKCPGCEVLREGT